MAQAYLTAKYKLHNPSCRRRAMLLDAMRRAHLGYDKLLKAIRPDVEAMVQMVLEGQGALKATEADRKATAALRERLRAARWISEKKLRQKLQIIASPLPLGNGPKQSIIADASAQAKGYIELKLADNDTAYPTCSRLRVDPEDFSAALDGLAGSQTVLEEKEFRGLMNKLSRPVVPRPLNIIKNRITDGALLLQDQKGRLFVFVNLLPRTAKRKHRVTLDGLVDTRTGEVMQCSTSCGELFPLEAGDWHSDKFLSKGTLQSSRLIHDGKDFYFAATFVFEANDREPKSYVGVERGIDSLASWSVVDQFGNEIEQGNHSGTRLRSFQLRDAGKHKQAQRSNKTYSARTLRAVADEEIHRTANEIVALAVKHNARVVLEDVQTTASVASRVREKKVSRRRGAKRRILTNARFTKLKFRLEYRLRMQGFTSARSGQAAYYEVSPAYTSVTCAQCGHQEKESRKEWSVFLCSRCGHKVSVEVNVATMIAAKGRHIDNVVRSRPKGRKLRDDERFTAWFAASRNGGGADES